MFCMCLSFLTICYLSIRSPVSCTVKLLSNLNLFVFRTWVRGGQLALPSITWDFTSLMIIPLVVVSLGPVYCLPILALLNMTLCCGIFRLGHPNFTLSNICFPIFFFKSMSPCYLVMCAFEQNIGFLFPHNYINPHNRLPLSIVTFGVLPRSPPHLENSCLELSLMIIPVLSGSTLSPINRRFSLFFKISITPLKHNSIKKIVILRNDNGQEFQNHNLSEFLASKWIVHQNSCTYTPQQNGVAKRKNCHLLEVARSLMLSTSLPS